VTVVPTHSSTDRVPSMSMNNNADIKLVQQVNTKLAMRGIRSPCHVMVACHSGEVTLTGTVVQAHQKMSAMRVAQGITGVKRVINQLMIKANARS
jgi:osmotically-inducible protein OsmY